MSTAPTRLALGDSWTMLGSDAGLLLALGGVGVAAVVLGVLLTRAVLQGLPADPALEEIDDDELPEEVRRLVAEYEHAGFSRIGDARAVGTVPPGVVVPMLSQDGSAFGTVFHVAHGEQAITACDVVSPLRHELSGLTTGSHAMGGTAPAWPGALRQMLPGAAPAALLASHVDALSELARQGLSPRPARAEDFEPLFRGSFRLQRDTFLRAPVRNLLRCVWRAATGTNPHVGPLSGQRAARSQIEALRNGTWPDDRARQLFGA